MSFYVVNKQQADELKHYGVVGMKWGIRKAKRKGVDYAYRSMGQKKYEKKLAKAKANKADAEKISKYRRKLETFKIRDRNRVDYAKRTNEGSAIAKGLLLGPFGGGNYSRMRSAGYGKVSSYLVSNVVTSTLALPISIAISKTVENKRAKQELEVRDRYKKSR